MENLQRKISTSYERIQCSECGSYFRRRQVSGTVKWGCSKHIQDRTQCGSNYYSEERIYDAFVAMVNKLRFSEYDIMGQTLLRLESAELKRKQKNTPQGRSAGTLQI